MSGLLRRLRRLHRRVSGTPGGGDRGTSMVELMAAMTIMAICGAVFTGAVVTLNRTSNQAQAQTNTATQNNQAYQALDRSVRYAAGISQPGLGASGSWYVELSTTTTGTETCTQLRVDAGTGQLQRRRWTAEAPADLTGWVPIASGLTNGAAAAGSDQQPFVLRAVGATAAHQRLGVTIVSRSGPVSQPASSTSSFDLTALNSPAVPTSPICQQVTRP